MILSAIALVMIFIDHRFAVLDHARRVLDVVVTPVFYVANGPSEVGRWMDASLKSRSTLIEENERLRQSQLALQRHVQKLASLTAENVRLRELLNSSGVLDDSVLISEIIGVDADPMRHEVVINRGSNDGIVKGQAILDANGLMGQITRVGPFTSRGLLITDPTHAIPVHVNRNGVRAIVVGSGHLDRLYLTYVPDTADVRVGDLLVSSGLGGRFPMGYPVGTITRLEHDPGRPFALVEARPMAHIDRSHHVLLVFKDKAEEDNKAPAAQKQAMQAVPEEPEKKETTSDL